MKKSFINFIKSSAIFLIIAGLAFSNLASSLLADISLNQLANDLEIKTAQAATLEYVGGASNTGTGATYSVSLTGLTGGISSTAAAGDLVIVVTGWSSAADGNPGISSPTGYTEVYDVYKSDTRDANMSVNWKIMGGTPDTSVTVLGFNNAANGGATVVQVWRGADQTTPMDVTPPAFGSAINAAHPDSPSITPVTSGAYVLTVGLGTGDTTPLAHTAPTGYSNTVSAAGSGSTMSTISDIASKAWTSGAEDAGAWTGGDANTSSDSWTGGTLALRPANDAPTVTVDNPPAGNTAAAEGANYDIQYDLADADSTATVDFYYETDGDGAGGTAIAACQNQAEGTNATCTFSTSILTVSTAYYIYGVADDTVNPTVTDVSSGTVTVNDAPTLTVTEPDGTGDTVLQGDAYNITYDLADTDSVVTVDFYYDSDAAGLDGTAITGCVNKVEGTGATCAWDTTGITPGTYYIYGRDVTDSVNAEVSDYSPGQITINASTVITVAASGTQTTPLIIPSGDNHVGGAFTMVRGTGSANVTSIIITDNGTVNANSNLSDVVVFYKQEVTCSSSIPGDATQFNSTPGTFNASEKTTVTGTIAVGTSQICVYVRLDVGSGASDAETMEIRVANPSTEVTVSAGTVSPGTAVDISGTTTLAVPKITVGTSGTQTASMTVGTGDNNVGGAFTFVRNTSTANVTQIIISDTGTVNANSNVSDVIVYYKQEGSCSASIPVDATQFNSTPGTFNVSEKTTVTGSMAVGTSQICVYVRLDIADTASNGETLEIQITDPSTEITVSAGSVIPASAVAISGATTLSAPTYTSTGIPFLYTSANWGTDGSGVSFYLEVYMRQTTGTAYARLYNETDTAAVSGSVLSTTSGSFTRLRTSALTLTNGKTYRVQFGKVGSDAGETLGGKLVVNQNGGGGADLAEYYTSVDQLDLAEVVALDPNKLAGVKRSSKAYQSDVLGIVATQPGIILGENVGQSYPIALVGRVPVKVSTENGMIKSGDVLTSASVPGHAMKATKAGRVLGRALEALDPAKLRDCPPSAGSVEGQTCGTVMVFVNLIDYLGQPVEVAMVEAGTYSQPLVSSPTETVAGLAIAEPKSQESLAAPVSDSDGTPTTAGISPEDQAVKKRESILEFLKDLKEERLSLGVSSEVFTDRVSAAFEVITPQILTKGLSLDSISAAGDIINLQSDVAFFGRPYFTTDTGGFALIQARQKYVDVIFEKEYVEQPVISADLTLEQDSRLGNETDPIKLNELIEQQDRLIQAIFDSGVEYFVVNKTAKGFRIVLNKPAASQLRFSWVALAVKGAKTFTLIEQSEPATAAAETQEHDVPADDPDSSTPQESLEAKDPVAEDLAEVPEVEPQPQQEPVPEPISVPEVSEQPATAPPEVVENPTPEPEPSPQE